MTALKADAALPPVRLKRRKYMSTALLLIDELGFDPMSRQEASLFFRLVSYRYGRGAIMITTNKSVRDWTELLAGDEVLTSAILDRLLHRSHVLNIRGRSYRLRDLEDALKPPRSAAAAFSATSSWHRARCRPRRFAPASPVPLCGIMDRTCARRPLSIQAETGEWPLSAEQANVQSIRRNIAPDSCKSTCRLIS